MNIVYENVIDTLSEQFPEYMQSRFFHRGDVEDPILFCFGFVRYIIEKMRTYDLNSSDSAVYQDETITRAFALFQNMEFSTDDEVAELTLSSIFDELVQDEDIRHCALKLLGEKSRNHLIGSMQIQGIDPQ